MKYAALILLLLLTACDKPAANKPDACGYTWTKTQPVASNITITHEPDWRQYPGVCNTLYVRGCYSSNLYNGKIYGAILTREDPEVLAARGGECNALTHELRHAVGETHAETHTYTPRDYTR